MSCLDDTDNNKLAESDTSRPTIEPRAGRMEESRCRRRNKTVSDKSASVGESIIQHSSGRRESFQLRYRIFVAKDDSDDTATVMFYRAHRDDDIFCRSVFVSELWAIWCSLVDKAARVSLTIRGMLAQK